MAKNSFLSKLLGMLSKLVSGVPSFMSGFDVQASDAQIDGDIFMSQRQLVSQTIKDTTGKPLTLNISIAVTNVKKVFTIKECIDGCDTAASIGAWSAYTKSNNSKIETAVQYLLGTGGITEDNVWSKNAGAPSLLNPKFTKDTSIIPTDWYWPDIVNELSFDIKCECPGYPSGTIGGKNFSEIMSLISIFPTKCGAVPADQVADNAFDVNPTYLVMPILILIQNYLKQYLDSTSEVIYGKQPPTEESGQSSQENTSMDTQNTEQNSSESSTGTPSTMTTTDNTNTQTGGTNVEKSKKINIKLQKITATSDINLLGIQTDYNPGEALDVVDDILSNPDFTDLITETPQTYEVCVDDDGYDINPCDELIVHPEENLQQLFIQAIQFSRNLHMIHWLAIGNDMEKLHIKAEELYGELDEEIDLLAELIVEKTGTIIDINKIETWDTVGTQNRTFQQGIECIKQYAQSFIDYIDITYPNQPSDIQSILDDWLRYWNKQINYFIVREQE